MRKVCGNIFEGCNVNINLTFKINLVKSYDYTIFILVYVESSNSIGM